jgi:hypothetical protein
MLKVVVSIVSALVIAAAAGCSAIPSADERKTFLAEEPFLPGYKVAVTSVVKAPKVESVIGSVMPLSGIGMVFRLGTLAAEPGARERVRGRTPLEKIDLAMTTALQSHLPVSASYLDRSSFGGNDFVPSVSNIAFDALQQAKAQGFDAMFFVHLQPAMISATGFGDRQLILTGTPVFRSIKTDHLLHFENYRLECEGGKSVPEPQLPAAVSACTDVLIGKMKTGLEAALGGRRASPAAMMK